MKIKNTYLLKAKNGSGINICKYCQKEILPTDSKNVNGLLSSHIIEQQISELSMIAFELTEDCNLSCKYCAYGKFYNMVDKREKKHITWEIILSVINYILERKGNNSSLHIGFYGGEPLIRFDLIKQLIDYLEKYEKKSIKFTYGITTNGTLLKNKIKYLIDKKFDILISIDGNKKANSFRVFNNGNESFDVLTTNINYIKNTYPSYFKENVSFNSVLHKRNNLPDIINFIKINYEKNVNITSLNTSSISPLYNEKFFKELYKDYSNDYNENIKNIIDKEGFIQSNPMFSNALRLLDNFTNYKFDNYNDLLNLDKKESQDTLPTATCLPFSKKMFITTDGYILPCERINYNYKMGEVSENEVKLDVNTIANKYNKNIDKLRRQCSKCAIYDNCQTCIFQLDLSNEVVVCPNYMSKNKAKEYYTNIINYLEQNTNSLRTILYEVATNN